MVYLTHDHALHASKIALLGSDFEIAIDDPKSAISMSNSECGRVSKLT